RRHTRSKRDWSSDVCSSDLAPTIKWAYNVTTTPGGKVTTSPVLSLDGTMVAFIESNDTNVSILHVLKWMDNDGTLGQPTIPFTRSEERRVGKEGRARWWGAT